LKYRDIDFFERISLIDFKMEDKLLYRIYVKGRVQGVGFRYSAVREAKRRGIKGFVKNQYDGSVYIEAEGSQEQLLDFVEWCRRGPGNVKSVMADPGPLENYWDFTVEF
jgi:acylphosphatase